MRLREQIDRALELEDGVAYMHWSGYRETDGSVFGLMVLRASRPRELGKPREPPDYSMLA